MLKYLLPFSFLLSLFSLLGFSDHLMKQDSIVLTYFVFLQFVFNQVEVSLGEDKKVKGLEPLDHENRNKKKNSFFDLAQYNNN